MSGPSGQKMQIWGVTEGSKCLIVNLRDPTVFLTRGGGGHGTGDEGPGKEIKEDETCGIVLENVRGVVLPTKDEDPETSTDSETDRN